MSLRVQKPGRSRAPAFRHPDRPPIWVDGRQKPPFDIDAYLRATLARARAASARVLETGADRAAAAAGRMPRLAAGTQALCCGAASSVRGRDADLDAETERMISVLAAAFPKSEPAPRAALPGPSDDDATLAAIRSLLRAEAQLRRPDPAPLPRAEAPRRPGRTTAPARVLALLSVAVLLPFGAASALHAHLSGEDLRLSE